MSPRRADERRHPADSRAPGRARLAGVMVPAPNGGSPRSRLARALHRGHDLIDVALSPGGPSALCRWRPMSMSAFRIVSAVAATGIEPRTILDIGANAGQFARAAVGRWPGARVVAFEPLPAACARLREVLAGHEVHEMALGDEDGTVAFHPHPYDLASSILRSATHAKQRFQWAEELPPMEVACRQLDSVLVGRQLTAPVLMKIDVQGFEHRVLTGALKTLRYVEAVLVEQAFDDFYEGQTEPAALDSLLSTSGLLFARVADVRRENSVIVEADLLYRRAQR